MTGDFQKYPAPLRDVLPHLIGEVCDIYGCWNSYRHLFMTNEARTHEYGRRLDSVLGWLQQYLQDDMIISVTRLMDKDVGKQRNLTMWSLVERCHQWDPSVASEVESLLDALALHISDIRLHRHKRIAHFDLPVSLGHTQLPHLPLSRLRESFEQLAHVLNVVTRKAANTTTMFDMMDHRDVTTIAEITIYKAMAYDAAVDAGTVDTFAWRKHIFPKEG